MILNSTRPTANQTYNPNRRHFLLPLWSSSAPKVIYFSIFLVCEKVNAQGEIKFIYLWWCLIVYLVLAFSFFLHKGPVDKRVKKLSIISFWIIGLNKMFILFGLIQILNLNNTQIKGFCSIFWNLYLMWQPRGERIINIVTPLINSLRSPAVVTIIDWMSGFVCFHVRLN